MKEEKIEKKLKKISNELDKIIKEKKNSIQTSMIVPCVYAAIFFLLGVMFLITPIGVSGLVLTLVSGGVSIIFSPTVIIKKYKLNQYIKLKNYIKEIKKNFEGNFYISYVITDSLKMKKYDYKTIKQLNQYIDLFDKNEVNQCDNEIGKKYNYVPYQMIAENNSKKEDITEVKLIEDDLKKQEKNNLSYEKQQNNYLDFYINHQYNYDNYYNSEVDEPKVKTRKQY